MSLFFIVAGYVALQLIKLFREQVLPLARNHLEHMQDSYDRLATALDKQASALDSLRLAQDAQVEALQAHNELLRALLDRPRSSRAKK
jgi:hypothetical protein